MWEELLMHICLSFRFKVSMNWQKTTIRVLNWSHLSELKSTMGTEWSGWDCFHLLWKVWSCIDTHWCNKCENYCKLELAKEKASSNGMVGFYWLLMLLTIGIIHVSFAFTLGVVVLKCSITKNSHKGKFWLKSS